MHQIVYISTAKGVTDAEVGRILAQSRRNNRRDGITGLLLYNGHRFLQAIEGPPSAIEAAYDRIRADPRHRAAVMLSSKVVDERQFGSWEMASQQLDGRAGQNLLIELVDDLVANVSNPSLRAEFMSYVRVGRAA